MDLRYLVYTPLMEEQSFKGWNKATIDYLIENEKMIKKSISKSLGKRKLLYINSSDIDDIYSEVFIYFYGVDDYNLSKADAITKDGREYILPIEGYVFKSIEFCIKRFITDKYNRECLIADNEIRDSEDNILDLLNNVADNKTDLDFENATIDLNQHCKEYEGLRYNYGIDIFQVWYIRLLIMDKKLDSSCFDTMMNILGISKRELKALSIDVYEDEEMIEFARGINKHGIEESIEILEQYIYSAEQIKKAIDSLEDLKLEVA